MPAISCTSFNVMRNLGESPHTKAQLSVPNSGQIKFPHVTYSRCACTVLEVNVPSSFCHVKSTQNAIISHRFKFQTTSIQNVCVEGSYLGHLPLCNVCTLHKVIMKRLGKEEKNEQL